MFSPPKSFSWNSLRFHASGNVPAIPDMTTSGSLLMFLWKRAERISKATELPCQTQIHDCLGPVVVTGCQGNTPSLPLRDYPATCSGPSQQHSPQGTTDVWRQVLRMAVTAPLGRNKTTWLELPSHRPKTAQEHLGGLGATEAVILAHTANASSSHHSHNM